MLTYKSATVDRFEGKQAVLKLENDQELRLLREDLEPAELGAAFQVQILPEAEAKLSQEELARTILNQILQDASKEKGQTDSGGAAA